MAYIPKHCVSIPFQYVLRLVFGMVVLVLVFSKSGMAFFTYMQNVYFISFAKICVHTVKNTHAFALNILWDVLP